MTTYVGLLRAVNVGGTGKLPMAKLKSLCGDLGFRHVETYIASGNVVFECGLGAGRVQAKLQEALLTHAGKTIGVFVRSASQMKAVLDGNPFAGKEPNLTYSFFLQAKPPADALDGIRGRSTEEIRVGLREIYVYYPSGMGESNLQLPVAKVGTARNMKTVAKLVAMSTRDLCDD